MTKRMFLSKLSDLNKFIITPCLVFLILQFPALGQTTDEEVIRVDSSLVILNATITDGNNKPVHGLTRKQFEILEDDTRQVIEFFEPQETPFAAVILIDTSGSMEQRVTLARSAAIKFLGRIRNGDQVAIYNFDSKVKLVQNFSNLRDLIPQVYDLKAKGWTVLNDAVYKAAKRLEKRPEKRRAIVILSDGADTKSGRSSKKALRAALAANATIYTVDMSGANSGGRGRMQNRETLKKFAKKTGGRFIKTPGGIAMREAFENIVDELGIQYTLGYYPSNTKRDGKWRKIKLTTSKQGLKIRTREGYNALKSQ